VAFGEIVECLARNEVQGDLSFELKQRTEVLARLAGKAIAARIANQLALKLGDRRQQR
jgi:hypothetical protein